MCATDKVWITKLTLIHKIIRLVGNSHAQVHRSIRRKSHYDVTDKNNNASFEDLNILYHQNHSLSCQTCCDTSNNVCLDLQNCRYSIFISNLDIFSLISLSDIVSINNLTLILQIISEHDVKHIATLPIKTIMPVLKVLTNDHQYHCFSYRTRYDTSNNVCLVLHNC